MAAASPVIEWHFSASFNRNVGFVRLCFVISAPKVTTLWHYTNLFIIIIIIIIF